MTLFLRNLSIFLLLAATASAQTVITSLSGTALPRSSRVIIQGSGFGTVQGAGRVDIGGATAPVTQWSDTQIVAYVPESAAAGAVNVQVAASGGTSSNLVPLTVTLRPAPAGRIRWRFQADAEYIESRPAIADDGTVYTIDANGNLYALTSDGGLKWTFPVPGFSFGNVSLGADGTIYTGSTETIFALAPDGTLKWQFSQIPSALILLGPNVGPDGNIYAVGTQGMGVFSLTPQGSLRWSRTENFDRPIVTLQELVFGPAAQAILYFHANRHLRGLGLDGTPIFTYVDALSMGDNQPAVSPDGALYSNLFDARGPGLMLGRFDDNGNLLWHLFDRFLTSTNILGTPEAGPDGVIYDGRNLISLLAMNPDGSIRWQYVDSGILFEPIVSPLNNLIFIGGVVNFGQPGFFEAVSTAGVLQWKVPLPQENGLNIVPMSRARFTPDGQTAYIGTSISGQTVNGYSYLYSVQTGTGTTVPPAGLSALTLTPATVAGGASSQGTVTLSSPAPAGGAAVLLISGNPAVAAVPAGVTVAAGAMSASFTITTGPVPSLTAVSVTASYAGKSLSSTLTIQPGTVPAPVLSSLGLQPATVRGGASSQGTVTLTGPAPAGGMRISLSSGNTAVAVVPASITVAAGAGSATFTVQTNRVRNNTSVTISAAGGSVTRRATLTVRR